MGEMAVFVRRRVFHRAHFVQIDFKTAVRQLQSRLAARKTTTDYTYALLFIHLLRSFDFAYGYAQDDSVY